VRSVSDRIEISPRTGVLLAGDLLAIGLFVAAGELQHGRSVLAGSRTFIEFVVGWLLVGTLLGAYGPQGRSSRVRAVTFALLGWTGGVAIAQCLRALRETGFYVAPTFVAVSLAVGGLLLSAWRLLATEISRLRR